jgi:acetylglutamate kinase
LNAQMGKAILVKIGGATLGSHDTTLEDIVALQREGLPMVVVHGGGKLITEWLAKQSIPSHFIRGERVTDEATLDVVIAVLAGLVNKELVAAINKRGGRAVGISGVDGHLIQSEVGNPEMGRVGRVTRVDMTLLKALLDAGYVPVIAPIGLDIDANAVGTAALNINADLVAGEIAVAMGAQRLIFLTDVAGICDRQGNLIPGLSPAQAEELIASGVASGGMIPKVRSCLRALSGKATACIIDGRKPHALLQEVRGANVGTTMRAAG